ncbi:MAG: TonB-dependent receptor plug domain-containing protein [Bacteroidales bacterium]|nr:TonB-dependent receptor plug domain-containing protein [Bacteroidales bacterium]
MRFRFVATLLILFLVLGSSRAQGRQDYGVSNVSADSLVSFLRNRCGVPVYAPRDTSDKGLFSIPSREPLEGARLKAFVEEAFSKIKAGGYSVSEYDGRYFVMPGLGLNTGLPAGYFLAEEVADDGSMLKYAGQQNVETTFQNKIYEIGDRNSGRKGRVLVSGYVRDAVSGEPLAGVSVYDDKGAYAITDSYGAYKIMLPVGSNTVNFSGYSLDDMKFSLQVFGEGGFDVTMKEKVFALTGAVVTSESQNRHKVSQMGIERVRINAIKNVPVAFGEADVLKVVMTLPGVKTVGEASNGFNVRGGSADQNLILFNGATVYNPSHMFGILSSFNSDVINDVELYKSSIPVEYGGHISSVLEVRSRDGNSKKVSGTLGLGLLTSRAHIEGPLGSKTTFNAGVRTTYSDYLLRFIPKESGYSDGAATFQDANIGISHRFNASNSLHVYGYLSGDRFRFSGDTAYQYTNAAASLKWRSNFSDKHSVNFTAGWSKFAYAVSDFFNPATAYSLSSGVGQYFFRSTFSSVLGAGNTLTYGLGSSYYDLDRGTVSPLSPESIVEQRALTHDKGVESALYLNDTWNITPAIALDAGIRLSHYYSLNDGSNFLDPEYRVSGKVSITPNFSWKAGFNTMHQYIHKISNSINISPTDTWKMSDSRLKPQSGWQAATGLYATLAGNTVEFSVEGYYKYVDNFVDYKSGAILEMNENLSDELVPTECRAYGVEVMLRKNVGKLNGWVSYTYSSSMQKEMLDRGFETINAGDWYPTSYDKPHDVKLVGNYKFTHRFSLSANLDYSTGRPVTIPVGVYQLAGVPRLLYSNRNGYRIPDYFRLDMAMIIEGGHYLKQVAHLSWTFGVYNVTGRHNPYSVFYTPGGPMGIQGKMLSVLGTQIPYVNFNLKF